jgi:hypothetical protein
MSKKHFPALTFTLFFVLNSLSLPVLGQCDCRNLERKTFARENWLRGPTWKSYGLEIACDMKCKSRNVLDEQSSLVTCCTCQWELQGFLLATASTWYPSVGASSAKEAIKIVMPHLSGWAEKACSNAQIQRRDDLTRVTHDTDGIKMYWFDTVHWEALATALSQAMVESGVILDGSRFGKSPQTYLVGLFQNATGKSNCSQSLAEGGCGGLYAYNNMHTYGCSVCRMESIWDGNLNPKKID